MLPNRPLIRYFRLAICLLLVPIAVIGILAGTAFALSGTTAYRSPNPAVDAIGHQSPVSVPRASSTPDPCGLAWRVADSPNPGVGANTLHGVAALSSNNVWAVGYRGEASANQPLAVRWNGATWTVVTMPDLPDGGILYGIAALSPNDIWAVGVAYTETLAMHWDGSQWLQVPTPSIIGEQSQLTAISAVSSSDIWAVGSYCCAGGISNPSQTLILHWNGTQWTIVSSPNLGSWSNTLSGVAAFAPNDAWAVGRGGVPSLGGTLAMHWDGTAWTVVDTPQTPIGDYYPYELDVVGGISGNDVWTIGTYRNDFSGRTLTEHWDGSQWSIVPSPELDSQPLGIHAYSSNDVWAVGYYFDTDPFIATFAMHWDGTAWSTIFGPNPATQDNRLYGVGIVAPNDVWAVGTFFTNRDQSLTEHYSDPCATPSPTATGSPPTATPTPSPTSTPSCPLGWNLVTSPNAGPNSNFLKAVASVSDTEAWAVGYYLNNSGAEQTLTMRRSGSQWQIVSSPNVGTNVDNRLTSVAIVASNNVWAAGYHTNGAVIETLVLHWDGSNWKAITSPSPGSIVNYLYGIAAISANDIWAVGTSDAGALTLHWNGTQWAEVLNPASGFYYSLDAVAAIASNDVWAVGTQTFGPNPDTLTMHWNGTQWTIVPSPSPGKQYDDLLTGVGAVSANDVWAVGSYVVNGVRLTLVLRWDGSTWTQVDSPRPSGDSYLEGMAVDASNNIWAAGYYLSGSPALTDTLIMRWNGSGWGIAAAPSPGESESALNSIAMVSSNEVLAVGYSDTGAVYNTLVERYLAACQGSTPTATGTRPPVTGTPTRTNTPLTGTHTPSVTATGTQGTAPPTASRTIPPASTPTWSPTNTIVSTSTPAIIPTSTSCPLTFTDVPQGSTFYLYVRCLACRGIVSGYADGTFKPNNNVTRGQLSKIVSNAASFSDPQPSQIFQDVPVGSTFQLYIGRLASRGYIGGYTCGGPGEPCVGPSNLPYFRPNNNATRGQISKIDANAAGFNDDPAGQQFEDVAVGSTYYTYTNRLVIRNIMSGYTCGGPGEPCVGPSNLPYFRPNNNATRGQISKIVANTFFPGCNPPERR